MTDTDRNRTYSVTESELRGLFLCRDCGVDTRGIGEYYMLRDDVWSAAGCLPGVEGELRADMLCIGCFEQRLGRRLRPSDFMLVEANVTGAKSPRLRRRLLGRKKSFHGHKITKA